MTAAIQPSIFDAVTETETKYRRFMERGIMFWRRQGAAYGEDADWSTRFSAARMARRNAMTAENLQALGGLGSVW